MDEFRFVHASDLHLDTPFTDIGLTPPSVSAVLRDASLRAWDGLVRLTIERRAECLLLSGGLYDGSELGLRAQLSLREGLQTLAESRIPVFIVLGGRDRIDAWSAVSNWPSNVTIFDSSGTSVPLRREGEHLATIHGLSHPAADAAQRLHNTFSGDSSGLQIGILHGAVGADDETSPCARVSLEELRRLPVGYWALGHEPARRTLSREPWVVYPGTPQSRRGTAGGDACGAIVVEVANAAIREISFAALDVVRSRSVEIVLAERVERTELLRQALDRARELRRENGPCALLLEARLRGRMNPPEELSAWLVSELRTRTEDWNPFVWWTIAGDRTAVEPLRSDQAGQGEIALRLVDRSKSLLGAALPRSSFLAREFEPLRRVWDAELDLEEARALIREAASLALDELAERPVE
jgi:DNA repair exonuclease SbcCD nuclease subunit